MVDGYKKCLTSWWSSRSNLHASSWMCMSIKSCVLHKEIFLWPQPVNHVSLACWKYALSNHYSSRDCSCYTICQPICGTILIILAFQQCLYTLLYLTNSWLWTFWHLDLSISACVDADLDCSPDTLRCTTCWCMFLDRSSISRKYKNVNNCLEIVSWSWVQIYVLCKSWSSLATTSSPWTWSLLSGLTPLYVDNTSAIQIATNLILHQQTKHITVDRHSICQHVSSGIVHLCHVCSQYQLADLFTKAMTKFYPNILAAKLIVCQVVCERGDHKYGPLCTHL